MNGLIKDTKQHLTHIQNTGVGIFSGCKLVTDIRTQRLVSLVVRRKFLKDNLLPDEVLKHLRGSFDKVSLNICASKLNMLSAGTNNMHDMAEFMEECYDVIVG